MKKINFFALFIFISCTGDFGDKVKKFVNSEIPGLSKQIADSGIERRMYEGKFLALTEMSLETRVIEKELKEIIIMPEIISSIKNSNSALKAYDVYYHQEAEILKLLSFVLDAKKKRKEFIDICEKGNQHELQNLVSAEIFNMALPDENYTVSISTDWIETIVQNIGNIITGENSAKQIGIMEEAISKIPKKIISQEELEIIYQNKCEDIDIKMQNQSISSRNTDDLGRINDLAIKKLSLLGKAKNHVVSLYYEFRAQEIYALTGLGEAELFRIEAEAVQKKYHVLNSELLSLKRIFFSSHDELLDNNYESFLRQAIYNKNFIEAFKKDSFFLDIEIKTIDKQIQMVDIFYKMKIVGREE